MFRLLNTLLEGKYKDITESELEKTIKVGKGTISQARKNETDLSFLFILRSVKLLSPKNELQLMKKFIRRFTSPKNLRISMEYALSMQEYELCRELIEKNRGLGRENNDWAETFEIALHAQEREISQEEIFKMIQEAKPKYLETKVLINVLKCYVYYYKREWSNIMSLSEEIDSELKKIKNEYIKNTFTCRFYSYLAHTKLHYNNEPSKARNYAKHILECEFTTFPRIHVHNLLGSTYMLDNYEKSLEHFEKYIEEMESVGNTEFAEKVQNMDIAFIKNHWEVGLVELQTNDMAEQAHNYVKEGDIQKANKIFDELESKQEQGLTPFQKYYKGIGNNDPKLLFESLVDFMVTKDKYFATLPKTALESYEVYAYTSEMIYNKF